MKKEMKEKKIKLAQEKVDRLKKSLQEIGFQIEETAEGELKLKN